ncbi:hypothetical protein PCC9214_01538 [Planktothrix tepida]|uniref:Methyltransferase domain-containing protein n=2 Tax=Planktothrix TaxID=54304 RepID=A0A1J1LH76_9CYAN|nr:class I SAM-dependent methyltransferase [Planktothrix tepida]CAD5934931.1 hypothetical protein PCC9214_01538 [Planktothrix tepida]CUR31827.1 conserved hypothetical protein [Planktothrix tepida PCC 9214]
MKQIFTYISQSNLWQSSESKSGRGSEIDCTTSIRSALPDLFKALKVTSILDAPCGDFNWMRRVQLDKINYLGIDIVSDIIQHNQEKYSTDTIEFKPGDITKDDLPKVDLIICRDCMVHLPLLYGCSALKQFQRSGSTYLLSTTYPKVKVNIDVAAGSWRPLNLCLPPYNCGTPLSIISDPSDDTGEHSDKSIGLWELNAIEPRESLSLFSPQVLLTTWIRQVLSPSWKL